MFLSPTIYIYIYIITSMLIILSRKRPSSCYYARASLLCIYNWFYYIRDEARILLYSVCIRVCVCVVSRRYYSADASTVRRRDDVHIIYIIPLAFLTRSTRTVIPYDRRRNIIFRWPIFVLSIHFTARRGVFIVYT